MGSVSLLARDAPTSSASRDSLWRWVASGALPTTYAADDHVALVWRDGVLIEAIGEAPERLALKVERSGDRAVEHEIPVRQL